MWRRTLIPNEQLWLNNKEYVYEMQEKEIRIRIRICVCLKIVTQTHNIYKNKYIYRQNKHIDPFAC